MVFQVLTKHQMLFRQFYNPLFDIGIQIQTIAPLGPIDVVHRDTYVYYVKQYLISYLNESQVRKHFFIKKVLFFCGHTFIMEHPPKMISIFTMREFHTLSKLVYVFSLQGLFPNGQPFFETTTDLFISSIRTFVRSSPLPTRRILIIEL